MSLYTVTAYGHDDRASVEIYAGSDYVESDTAYVNAVDAIDRGVVPSAPGRMLSRDQRVTVSVMVERGDTIASCTAYVPR